MAVQHHSDITVTAVTEDAATAARFYAGFGFANSTGSAIVVNIYDGTDSGDILLDPVTVPANSSVHELYPNPLPLTSGSVFVDWTTGITGNIRVIV
jgi:hypothetical protein